MNRRRGRAGPGLGALAGALGMALVLVCAGPPAGAQKATEQYIPIGQSPGLSRKYTSIGPIAEVNVRDQTVTIADPGGARTVRITEKTRIWLDRSKIKQPNLRGLFADLQKGRLVEVKYLDVDRRQIADWIKVEVGPS